MRNAWIAMVLAVALAGCAARRPAPVTDRAPPEAPPAVVEAAPAPPPAAPPPPAPKPPPTHTVKRGETLVGIALQYGLDYRELAAWNNIVNPNVLREGQVLVVAAPAHAKPYTPTTPLAITTPPVEARPASNTALAKVEPRAQKLPFSERALAQLSAPEPGAPGGTPVVPTTPVPETPAAPAVAAPSAPPPAAPSAAESEKAAGTDREDVDWIWPVKGKVLANFTEASKGIDIAGKKGTPVRAAAAGRVVYVGEGVRGYGKLVVIKHNNTWLSAYAHNDSVAVKEQQDVRKGQEIARMGATDSDQVKLHFEVRRQGKPVDPAKILGPM